MLPLDELVPVADGDLVLVEVAGGGGHRLVHVSDLKQHSLCRRLLALQPDNVRCSVAIRFRPLKNVDPFRQF